MRSQPPGRDEASLGKRRGERRDQRGAAERLGREELDGVARRARARGASSVAVAMPGSTGTPALEAALDDRRVERGRDDELRARGERLVELRRRADRARADDEPRAGERRDDARRGLRAERHLDRRRRRRRRALPRAVPRSAGVGDRRDRDSDARHATASASSASRHRPSHPPSTGEHDAVDVVGRRATRGRPSRLRGLRLAPAAGRDAVEDRLIPLGRRRAAPACCRSRCSPGAIALTFTPCGAHSFESARTSPTSPDLAAV